MEGSAAQGATRTALWRTDASANCDVKYSHIVDRDGSRMIVTRVVSLVRTEVLVATRIFDIIISERDRGRAGVPDV